MRSVNSACEQIDVFCFFLSTFVRLDFRRKKDVKFEFFLVFFCENQKNPLLGERDLNHTEAQSVEQRGVHVMDTMAMRPLVASQQREVGHRGHHGQRGWSEHDEFVVVRCNAIQFNCCRTATK